jgi:hypothetical protein
LIMQTLESAITDFRQILDAAEPQLSRFSDAEASLASANGHWSRKQVLGHLIDSAANNHHRFVRAQFESDLSMPNYAQEAWVATQHYQERKWSDLIALWRSYNQHLLHLMERLPDYRRLQPVRIGGAEPVTLEFLMADYVHHLRHHWEQLQAPVHTEISNRGASQVMRSQSG